MLRLWGYLHMKKQWLHFVLSELLATHSRFFIFGSRRIGHP